MLCDNTKSLRLMQITNSHVAFKTFLLALICCIMVKLNNFFFFFFYKPPGKLGDNAMRNFIYAVIIIVTYQLVAK